MYVLLTPVIWTILRGVSVSSICTERLQCDWSRKKNNTGYIFREHPIFLSPVMKPTNVLFAVVAHPPCLACAVPTQSIACVVHTLATRIPAVLTVVTRITYYETNLEIYETIWERIPYILIYISCLSKKFHSIHGILVLQSGGFFPAGHAGQSTVLSSHDSVTKPHNIITIPNRQQNKVKYWTSRAKRWRHFFASTCRPA